jgi:hypothetical protein
MLWGPIRTRGNLTGSVAKMRQQLKAPKSTHRTTAVAKIWVQGGKIMGFVAAQQVWSRFLAMTACFVLLLENTPFKGVALIGAGRRISRSPN